uniref:Acyl-CoA dehydrogenase/oxidase N-terminal domain-containing protein n=1 Tax=Cuerna arida TaxID=1464854 RepID=A0A1B6GAU8_9HEMI
MLSTKGTISLTKLNSLTRNKIRCFSDQSLVVAKKTGASLKLAKKPQRPPFMKNVFLGIYDVEMLTYPELDKEALIELRKRVQPCKDYFKNNVDSNALSVLKMVPNELIEGMKNLGLFGQTIPNLYGGSDQGAVESALISEIIAKDLDIALMLYSHNHLSIQTLLLYGNEHQKQKYLPKLASGEWIAAFCMSESVSSSDIVSLKVHIAPSEENPEIFLLNGQKQWVVNGINSNLFIVIARSSLKVHTGGTIPSVRLILVERDAPGVTVVKSHDHIGLNASNISEVHFKDTPVQQDCFIGEEVQGFEMCSQILNSGRYNIGAITTSLLKNMLGLASDFIASRKQFDKSLIECERIQDKVADIATTIYTLESMTYHTASILDQYENPDSSVELAIIKAFSFTEGRRCLDLIMELMGGRAFMISEITQKYFRDFRTMEVFDGTTDIANLYISLNGLQYAGMTMNETVGKLRNPFDYPNFIMKRLFTLRQHTKDNPKLILKLYEQLHPSLKDSANELEYCVLRLQYAVTVIFTRYGTDVVNQQIELMRLADAAIRIYAMTAVLARASRSYCIGLKNAQSEVKYAIKICSAYKRIVQTELNDLISGLVISGDVYSLNFGPEIFRNHGYFLEHPLERSF